MSTKSDVWNLFLSRKDQWLTRQEIEFVGGVEAMRRMREIRTGALALGYEIESRSDPKSNQFQYRLKQIATEIERTALCLKCGHPATGGTQPTVDPRWRMGKCIVCDDKNAMFRTTVSAEEAWGKGEGTPSGVAS